VDAGVKPVQELLAAAVEAAGVEPPAKVTLSDGSLPRAIGLNQFGSGPVRYLAIQQDILVRGVGEQALQITLPEPAVVYDIRAGKRVGEGSISEWQASIDRGWPLVYALLPYEVTDVQADVPASAGAGSTVEVAATVAVSAGRADTHVVRMDVFAPGSDGAHREYSQNILCERGAGFAQIPFALSDAQGAWRLVFRDVASGTTVERTLTLN